MQQEVHGTPLNLLAAIPGIFQHGMLDGQNKEMPCLCFQSFFTSQNTSKTHQVSFSEKYHRYPIDCKLYKMSVARRLQIQDCKQAGTRSRLSWSGQFICLQTVPTRSSGREEPVVRMMHGGRLQRCRLSSPAPGSRMMLDIFTSGFEPTWKNVSWRCWQTAKKPLKRGGGLCAKQVVLFKGCLFGFLPAAVGPGPSKLSIAVLFAFNWSNV